MRQWNRDWLTACIVALSFVCIQRAQAQLRPVAPADQVPTLPDGPYDEGGVLHPMGEAAPEEAPQPKDRIRVRWADSSIVIGELPADAAMKIKSRLGEFEVKLKDVARIDPAVEEDEFRVIFASGDRVTGKLNFVENKLKTAFGELPLTTDGLLALEAGKLHSRALFHSRQSPDGRSFVRVRREFSEFEPQVANPDEEPTIYSPPNSSYAPGAAPFAPEMPRVVPRRGRR